MAKKTSKKSSSKSKAQETRPEPKAKRPHPARAKLLEFALTLPEAWEDHPWGESAAKVKKKVFAFFGVEKSGLLSLCVKLPDSGADALALPQAEPAGYGLGKSGWVHANFERGDDVDLDELREWIVESYCAIAPKSLVAKVHS